MEHQLALTVLEEPLAVCRLQPGIPVPESVMAGGLSAVIHTQDETTIVCPEGCVPDGALAVGGWLALKVKGPLDFSITGVLASLTIPLARAGVSIFAISTYDTDYVLVKEEALDMTLRALRSVGHTIDDPE